MEAATEAANWNVVRCGNYRTNSLSYLIRLDDAQRVAAVVIEKQRPPDYFEVAQDALRYLRTQQRDSIDIAYVIVESQGEQGVEIIAKVSFKPQP